MHSLNWQDILVFSVYGVIWQSQCSVLAMAYTSLAYCQKHRQTHLCLSTVLEFVEQQDIHKVPQLECSRDCRVEYSSIGESTGCLDAWMDGEVGPYG